MACQPRHRGGVMNSTMVTSARNISFIARYYAPISQLSGAHSLVDASSPLKQNVLSSVEMAFVSLLYNESQYGDLIFTDCFGDIAEEARHSHRTGSIAGGEIVQR